jgi:thiol-disulfide isomerase/thioredoxin
MTRYGISSIVSIILLVQVTSLRGAEQSSKENPSTQPESKIVRDLYPNIEMGFLNDAVVSDLSSGVLLKADNIIISDKELNKTIADANEKMQPQLKKYASLVLEQIAIPKLFVLEIKNEAATKGQEITEKDENKIIQDYIRTLAKTIKVSEEKILEFYNSNKDSLSGATLAQVKPQIEQLLAQEELQKLIDERIRTIGQRMKIEISAPWLMAHAALAMDNPVNKARDSGKPTLVDFGSKGCVPCDMLAPILETLREKYKGKANVVVVQTGEEPVLSSRYGIEVIPLQIFYDKTGKEVFRHTGFFPKDEIEKQLSKMGVK